MSILVKPLVTEKISAENEKGKYGFLVEKRSNKIEIKQAVEKMYGVNVEEVKTMIYGGKKKSKHTKSKVVTGKTASYKKAIVKVADGELIDFYSGI